MAAFTNEDARKAAVLAALKEEYPDPRPTLEFTNPYETLIATMLSAQCTDRQVNRVTPAVFRDFPDARAMAAATPEILYPYVKSCGFKTKAERIVQACQMIVQEHGGKVPNTMEALTRLPGVGRKTASVVLASAFGQPAMAVDTHVLRVSNRLGLAAAKTPEQAERQLIALIPARDLGAAHLQILFHGRNVCHARKPGCAGCALSELCPSRTFYTSKEESP